MLIVDQEGYLGKVDMVEIVIAGYAGRMGKSIYQMASIDNEIRIVGAVERENHPEVGSHVDEKIRLSDEIKGLLNANTVLIDFTNPGSTMKHLEEATKCNTKMLIGTTGFTVEQEDIIKKSSDRIAILESHNYGIGMNAFWEIIRVATELLRHDYQVEIVEFHAASKPDVPSGTGMTIGKIIAEVMGENSTTVINFGREQTKDNVRPKNDICFHSLRAGSYRSEHKVIFAGDGEYLEFTHKEESPSIITRGVLLGAKFLANKKPGLYSMADVLRDAKIQ